MGGHRRRIPIKGLSKVEVVLRFSNERKEMLLSVLIDSSLSILTYVTEQNEAISISRDESALALRYVKRAVARSHCSGLERSVCVFDALSIVLFALSPLLSSLYLLLPTALQRL